MYSPEFYNSVLVNYPLLTRWIDNNENELRNLDKRYTIFQFEVPEHPLITRCKESETYSNFILSIKKDKDIFKKLNKKYLLLGTEIELKEDYIMYQLIYRYIHETDNSENLLKSFLDFFYVKELEANIEYKVSNLNYDSFTLFSNDHLEINFEKLDDGCYIYIKMRDNLKMLSDKPKSLPLILNLIEYVSLSFQLLTHIKILYNHIKSEFSNVIDLIPDPYAMEIVHDSVKIIKLESELVDKFKKFWQLFYTNYKDHRHSVNLFINSNNLFNSYADKFLYLIYCLESFVGISGRDSLTYKISTRTAKLIEKNQISQIIVSNEMKKFYGDRSDYVHNGINNIDSNKTARLEEYVIGSFRNKILINHFWIHFQLQTIFEENNVSTDEVKKKSIESIIDFVNFHDCNIIKYYNSI